MKILCTGDLHMGRRASRLPPGLDERRFSATAMWGEIVEFADREKPDFVVLTGDIVDRANRFYEAYGPLENGLRRIAEAGIPTYAVAGNHDFDVLPRLVHTLGAEKFHLLGRDGKWEYAELSRNGRTLAHLHGWSFPREHFRDDPLRDYGLMKDDGAPTIGVLHADINPNSSYAPISLYDLQQKPVTIWLLGHIHAPRLTDAAPYPPVLYPGSPLALDPGEMGDHGPWLIEIDAQHRVKAKQVPLSRMRYETIAISDLDNVRTREEFQTRLSRRIGDELNKLVVHGNGLECVSFRLLLQGTCPLHRSLAGELRALAQDVRLERHGVTAVVEKAIVETRPARDLDELARGNDAAAVLARLLLDLDQGAVTPDAQDLSGRIRQKIESVRCANAYQDLWDEPALNGEAVRQLVRREACSLLDELVAQKEEQAR
jgi:DNA repair exonuclease SbcCD nuclease subunit